MGEIRKEKSFAERHRHARVFLEKKRSGNAFLLGLTREFRLTAGGIPTRSSRMLTPVLEKVLILQERDARRRGLEAQLKAVPGDIGQVEQRIAAEKSAIENAKADWNSLESKKKLLETEIGSAEAKLAKYKTQQSQVRKNDEYQALGHEIETTEGAIGALEGSELEIMYAIDEAKKKFAAAEAELKANIAGHQARIAMLRERETGLRTELEAAQQEFNAAREQLDDAARRVYDRLAARALPVCVPIRGGKCGGCHLKVSSEVESASRGKSADGKLAACDQCGRLVYWES